MDKQRHLMCAWISVTDLMETRQQARKAVAIGTRLSVSDVRH